MDKVNLKKMLKNKRPKKNNCYFCKLNRQIDLKDFLIGNAGKMLTVKTKNMEEPIIEVEINYCPICGEKIACREQLVNVKELNRLDIENNPEDPNKDKLELLDKLS